MIAISFKPLYANPNFEPETSPFSGRVFIRDWPKRCPQCEEYFYARRLETDCHEPWQKDPDPPMVHLPGQGAISSGLRATCGDPMCYRLEHRHQASRSAAYRQKLDEIEGRRETAPAPISRGMKKG